MIRVATSRRYFKTIVVTIVVATALYALGASASAPAPQQQSMKGVPTVLTDPRFKDNDELPTPAPAPAVIPPGAAVGAGTNYNGPGVTGRYDSSGRFHETGNANDGYTEITRQKDANGNIVKTTRDVDLDKDGDAKIKTTVKVGVDGPVSTTRTEIKAK